MQLWILFILGAVLGSFINVCIFRLPDKRSVVWPPSHCPKCRHAIPIWDNIPVISYLLLLGKCRHCRQRISIIYPLVELLSAVLLVAAWHHFGQGISFLHYSVLLLLLLPITFIDMHTKLILNVLTIPGIVVALLFACFSNDISIYQALLGTVLGGGFLFIIGTFGRVLFKKESMGGGDVKLGAMIGAFIGPEVIIVLFFSFFLAFPIILIGLGSKRLSMTSSLPFGPFIALSTAIIVLFGDTLYQQYFQMMGIS